MFKEDDFITNRNREGNEEYPTWKVLTEGYINMLGKKVDALQAELKLGIDLKLQQVENSMEIIKQDIKNLRRHFKMSDLGVVADQHGNYLPKDREIGYRLNDPCQLCNRVIDCNECDHFRRGEIRYCHCGREMSIAMTSSHKGFWLCICGNQEFENFKKILMEEEII